MKKNYLFFQMKVFFYKMRKFFCDNIDLNQVQKVLNKKFEVNLFGRKSSKKELMKLN